MLRVINISNTGLARRPKRSISKDILITNLGIDRLEELGIESIKDFRIYSLSVSLSVISDSTSRVSEKSLLAL